MSAAGALPAPRWVSFRGHFRGDWRCSWGDDASESPAPRSKELTGAGQAVLVTSTSGIARKSYNQSPFGMGVRNPCWRKDCDTEPLQAGLSPHLREHPQSARYLA